MKGKLFIGPDQRELFEKNANSVSISYKLVEMVKEDFVYEVEGSAMQIFSLGVIVGVNELSQTTIKRIHEI